MEASPDTRAEADLFSLPEVTVGLAVADRELLEGITAALTEDGLRVTARAPVAEVLIEECAGHDPSAVVLAGEGSGSPSPDDIRLIAEELPRSGVVVVSSSPGARGARKALRAGARGLVFESRLRTSLPVTVRAVCSGQLAVPEEVMSQVWNPAFSFREKQVLGMVILGFTNQEIGTKLHLAEKTVKSHLTSAFKKLGVDSRHEAAAMILDPGQGLGPGILSIPDADAYSDDRDRLGT